MIVQVLKERKQSAELRCRDAAGRENVKLLSNLSCTKGSQSKGSLKSSCCRESTHKTDKGEEYNYICW